MLIFTIAVSFEIKAGKITKDKFINIKDNGDGYHFKDIEESLKNGFRNQNAELFVKGF